MNIIKTLFFVIFILFSCSNDKSDIIPIDSPKSFSVLGYCTPAPEGSVNAKYSILNRTIAQVNFNYNNINYNYIASKKLEDILSLYNNLNNYKNYIDEEANINVMMQTNNEEYIAYWNINNIYYCLSSKYENSIYDLCSILIKNKS